MTYYLYLSTKSRLNKASYAIQLLVRFDYLNNMRTYKVNEKLGKRIKKFRKASKVTQEDLADKVGLHYTTISRIERGMSNSPVQTVEKIAKALKVSISDLF